MEDDVIERLDHLVLTVRDLDATIAFYELLGMRHELFEDDRSALRFGDSKINLHHVDRMFEPKASHPTPGSADLCFVARAPLKDILGRLEGAGVEIEVGPVNRVGALGEMTSIYMRDPDENLVELCWYDR